MTLEPIPPGVSRLQLKSRLLLGQVRDIHGASSEADLTVDVGHPLPAECHH